MSSIDVQGKTVDAGHVAVKRGGPAIGLVLGSGAARGFAHIGVMRALQAHGIKPDIIVGTSMGALVGGCYATDQLDTLEDWARSLTQAAHHQLSRRPHRRLRHHRRRTAGAPAGGIDRRYRDRGSADPLRRNRNRDRHRPRSLADARFAGAGAARLLRAAGNFSAGSSRRPLAGRRRAGQSGAGIGGARARRPRRHCGQYGCRPFRPRRHDRQPRRGCRRRPSPCADRSRRATALPACAACSAPNARSSVTSSPATRGRVSQR